MERNDSVALESTFLLRLCFPFVDAYPWEFKSLGNVSPQCGAFKRSAPSQGGIDMIVERVEALGQGARA